MVLPAKLRSCGVRGQKSDLEEDARAGRREAILKRGPLLLRPEQELETGLIRKAANLDRCNDARSAQSAFERRTKLTLDLFHRGRLDELGQFSLPQPFEGTSPDGAGVIPPKPGTVPPTRYTEPPCRSFERERHPVGKRHRRRTLRLLSRGALSVHLADQLPNFSCRGQNQPDLEVRARVQIADCRGLDGGLDDDRERVVCLQDGKRQVSERPLGRYQRRGLRVDRIGLRKHIGEVELGREPPLELLGRHETTPQERLAEVATVVPLVLKGLADVLFVDLPEAHQDLTDRASFRHIGFRLF